MKAACEIEECELFFFKQKTAYEIKECDWSSDVCSSDLRESLRENEDINKKKVTFEHFNQALDKVRPSVNEVMIKNYQALLSKFESGDTEDLRYMT